MHNNLHGWRWQRRMKGSERAEDQGWTGAETATGATKMGVGESWREAEASNQEKHWRHAVHQAGQHTAVAPHLRLNRRGRRSSGSSSSGVHVRCFCTIEVTPKNVVFT